MNDNPGNAPVTRSEEETRSRFGFDLSDDRWLNQLRESVQPNAGLRIGAYELMGELRQGGQGVVVQARQPHTQRLVALKRLAHGRWSTPQERFRFEREVEAAAALNHPNIVTVHGLEFVEGQPLLAMEWVEGEPIDAWARRGENERPKPRPLILTAFLKVCDAVHHAHQRGVIHRDLKPANILIGSNGEPKVLDFGLAKRFDLDTSSRRLTASGDFLGSPAYAAPEQLGGTPDTVDVRIDVYALGVILYELLTGRLPFVVSGGIGELFDAIRRGQPQPPSRLDPTVDGDLDAIVLKGIARERERRYASIDALSADLRRYFANEPVEARRGQTGYALRKFIRRYWVGVTTAAGFATVVAIAAVSMWISYVQQGRMLRETAAARDAEASARRSSERVQTMIEQLLLRVAEAGRGTDVAVRRELLSQAEQVIRAELSDAPEAQARAYDAIGRTYQQLALYDEGERCLRLSLEMNLARTGSGSIEEAASATHLANLLQDRSRYSEAESLFRRALEIRAGRLGKDDPATAESLHNLGNVLSNRGEFQDALTKFQEAYQLRLALLGERHPDAIRTLTAIGLAHANLDDNDAAEACFRQVVAESEEGLGAENRETAGRYVGLGKILQAEGKLDEAEQYLRRGLTLFRTLLGNRHDNVAWAAHRLGVLLHARGKNEEAESLLREARETYRTVLGPDDPFVGYVCESLAALLRDTGRESEAAAVAAEAERIRAKSGSVCIP